MKLYFLVVLMQGSWKTMIDDVTSFFPNQETSEVFLPLM